MIACSDLLFAWRNDPQTLAADMRPINELRMKARWKPAGSRDRINLGCMPSDRLPAWAAFPSPALGAFYRG
jgi:hypothetical protein